MTIICLSNQLWDWPLWTNKRQVMSRLANLGHQVVFVDPPIRLQKLVKQVIEGKWSLKRLLTGAREVTTEFGTNAKLLDFTPVTLNYSEDPNLTGFNVGRLLAGRSPQPDRSVVLWVYNPSMREYVDKIPHDILVYDCVDDYPAMANYKRLGLSQRIKDWENVLVKKANVVFASAPGLVNRLKDLNERTYFAPNAGSYELFSIASRKSTACPVSLRGIKPPIIGFAGTIDDYKVDAGLVLKAAKACPDYSFVIVGPRADTDKAPDLDELSALPNVRLLPEVKYEDQVPYYAYFDAFIIPYRLNEYTVGGCFPVKFFDSLAAGLPTIVTNLPAYELYQSVCYIAKSGEEFVTMIKQAVSENSGSKETLRKNIAKENSWDNKVEKMLRVIKEL